MRLKAERPSLKKTSKIIKSSVNVLLVEPPYKIRYPPLSLMKISAYHKARGDTVTYTANFQRKLPLLEYDLVYITSLFTFDQQATIDCINRYKEHCKNAEIRLGGILCSLMPDYIHEKTGILPHVGLWMDVEFMPPDYNLVHRNLWSSYSYVFTSRGCPRSCEFCAVRTLEPTPLINPRWKEHISPGLPRVMIHDNNITAAGFDHFRDVTLYLKATKKEITFDNGFDCRSFTKEHSRLLAGLNLRSLRFAFDNKSADGHVQRAVELCLKNGIPASAIMVYVLFNYKDDLADAIYRATEVAKLGVRPYAMQYIPLDAMDRYSHYYGEWDQALCEDFSFYINKTRNSTLLPFNQWRKHFHQNKRAMPCESEI